MLAVCTFFSAVRMETFAEENASEVNGQNVAMVRKTDEVIETQDGWDNSPVESVYENEGYRVIFSLTGHWSNGYSANVEIENTGSKTIENWTIEFEFPGNISNIWNAEIISNENNKYIIKNAGWNQDISAGGSIEFGIIGTEEFPGFPQRYQLIGNQINVELTECSIDFKLTDYWETGFCGEIAITNNSDAVVEDWALEFDLDSHFVSIWNAVLESAENGHIIVKNAGYNANINPGEVVTFGFEGYFEGERRVPENYVLYQHGINQGIDSIGEDAYIVRNAKSQLKIGYAFGDSEESVTKNISLCSELAGASVKWISSKPAMISDKGEVVRPSAESEYVTLTAVVSSNDYSEEVEFNVRVVKDTYVNYNIDYIYDMESPELLYIYNEEVDSLEVYLNDAGYVSDISGQFSEFVVESPEEAILALYEVKSLMGCESPKDELSWVSTNRDKYGYAYRFRQTYKGIPIYGRNVVVATNVNGITSFLHSSYVNDIDTDVTPALSEDAIFGILRDGDYEIIGNDGLYIYVDDMTVLVYNIIAEDDSGIYNILVNADSGEIVLTNPMSAFENASTRSDYAVPPFIVETGEDLLGIAQTYVVNHSKNGGIDIYDINDAKRNINLYDASGYEVGGELPEFPIRKAVNSWTPGEISGIVNAGKCYDFYYDMFGRKGLDGKGSLIRVYINYNIHNAQTKYGKLLFGIKGGTYTMNAQGGLDTVGHEYTHAIMDDLTTMDDYIFNECGAIQEAYADIFGYFIEGKVDPYWYHGESNNIQSAWRCMSDPWLFCQPAAIGDKYYQDYTVDSDDRGGIHQNNTIISHACYLMWKNGIIDKDRLAELWYHSIILGYDSTTEFSTVRTNILTSAKEMGMSGNEIQIIKDAFDSVGVTAEDAVEIGGTNVLLGKVVVADADMAAGNNVPIKGATIEMVRAGGRTYRESTSDDGTFSVIHLLPGNYTISVSKESFYTVSQEITLTSSNINNYCSTIELIPTSFVGTGAAEGTIKDSITGIGVEGLTLGVRKGINAKKGKVLSTSKTSVEGAYLFDKLESGNYCVEVVDNRVLKDGEKKYYKTYFNIKILGGCRVRNQNATVSNVLNASQLRIVLNWGASPRDLDSHLIGPTSSGANFHLSFGDRSYIESGTLIADMDLDCSLGYGPETTTIYNPVEGNYVFYVHNYYSGTTEITSSGASVEVYMGNNNEPAYVFNVPTTGSGIYWTVFSYNSKTKRVTPINYVGSTVKK